MCKDASPRIGMVYRHPRSLRNAADEREKRTATRLEATDE